MLKYLISLSTSSPLSNSETSTAALPAVTPDVSYWFIVRAWCPECEETATVVRDAAADEIRCPQCDSVAFLGWEAVDR